MKGPDDAIPAVKPAMDSTHYSTATPTVNDGGPGRGKVEREEDAKKGGQDPLDTVNQATPDETTPSSPSLLPLPAELLTVILRDSSLTTLDRACCCLVSRAFLPIAQKALRVLVSLEVYPYEYGELYLLVDRHVKKTFTSLPRQRRDVANEVKELIVDIVKLRGDGSGPPWPDLDFDPAELKAVEESDARTDLTTESADGYMRRVCSLQDFNLYQHLEDFLQVASRLTSLTVLGEFLDHHLEDLFIDVHFPHLTHCEAPAFPLCVADRFPRLTYLRTFNPCLQYRRSRPSTPSFSSLRHLAILYSKFRSSSKLDLYGNNLRLLTTLEIAYQPFPEEHYGHFHPNLSSFPSPTCLSITLDSYFHHREVVSADPITFPPALLSLTLLATDHTSMRWVRLDPHWEPPLVGEAFLSTLPPTFTHLRLDPASFSLPALLVYLASPTNLPSLTTLTVLEAQPVGSKPSPLAGVYEDIAAAGRARGWLVRKEEYTIDKDVLYRLSL